MIGDIPMRRFENQIRDHEIIGEMLREIPNVHVGMVDGDRAFEQWRLSDLFAHYQLAKWKE